MKIAVVQVTPFSQNCTLIWDEDTKQAAVIDPGGDVDRILSEIGENDLHPEAIWLTHGHLDHAGGALDLRDALDIRGGKSPIPIIGPDRRDAMLLDSLTQQGARFGMQGLRNLTPDRWLHDGDTVMIASHVFDVLHCPGHTPGHIVFFNKAARFAQVGDVLFHNSIGRTDFPYGDHPALVNSIRTKLLPLGDDVTFVCGHGPNSTIGAERKSNPFIQMS